MSFLHTWRRTTDNNYRWETAPDQEIMDNQEDLMYEIRELRASLESLFDAAASSQRSSRPTISSLVDTSDPQWRGLKHALEVLGED